MILHAFLHALEDTVKVIPFLLAAFLVMEALEHYSNNYMNQLLMRVGKAGPLLGAVLGCVPQCGFSVAAANLYSGGVVTLGTLLAVFLSTSDEAVLILMSHPGSGATIGRLLFCKVLIGILAGYVLDLCFRRHKTEKHIEDMCRNCGCSNSSGILMPALSHALRLTGYLFFFTCLLNLAVEGIGTETLAQILGRDTVFQPFATALLGLLPNCASSILITELYLAGVLSFGSAVAGLCTGAGVGLAVLFKSNHPVQENMKIAGMLYGIGVVAGIILNLLPIG